MFLQKLSEKIHAIHFLLQNQLYTRDEIVVWTKHLVTILNQKIILKNLKKTLFEIKYDYILKFCGKIILLMK